MKISKFTVNNLGDPEPVIAQSYCRRITIGEDPSVDSWPTTDYEVTDNQPGSPFARRAAGTSFVFIGGWARPSGNLNVLEQLIEPGQVIGYVQTITGSTTFYQVEE